MGRVYTISLDALAVTAKCELLMVEASANSVLLINEIKLTQDLSTTSAVAKFMCFKTTTAAGTRGDAGVVGAQNPGDPTFSGTARQNILTGDGFSAEGVIEWPESVNVINGLHIFPSPELRPIVSGGEGFAVVLENVLTMTWSGWMKVEEFGKTAV